MYDEVINIKNSLSINWANTISKNVTSTVSVTYKITKKCQCQSVIKLQKREIQNWLLLVAIIIFIIVIISCHCGKHRSEKKILTN